MLEIIRDGSVIARVAAGSRWQVPDENRVVFNVQLDTVIPGYEVRQHVPPPPPPELTPEEIKAKLASYAAECRWQKEVGGTLWNGWPVHTDRESQGKIIAERLAIEAGERTDPDGWKFADGAFRLVSNTDFVALSNAVREHVRNCYAVEAVVLAQIDAETITTEAEIEAAFE